MKEAFTPAVGERVTFLPDGQSGSVIKSYPLASLFQSDTGATFTVRNDELARAESPAAEAAKTFAREQPVFTPTTMREARTLFRLEAPQSRTPKGHHAVIEGERDTKPLAKVVR